MYLKSLEVSGFKSFAKKSDLSFSTPVTAIVGPNGSGKSNIAEAFRFVLGEQSMKSMRGKRGEDLIFNGSQNTPRGNRASVVIALDNTQKQFPIDFDEVTLERVVYRDGANEYLINGSKARLKDIEELLASANIGSTGHHIISQGEADRILTASSRERREMIEDALGLKVFQYKKSESERKLLKTRENMTHVESLRREVAPHLRFLERQVKKIEKSLSVREELKGVYREYLKREDEYIAYHHDRILKEQEVPKAELATLQKELLAAKEVLQKAEKDDMRVELVSLESALREVRDERQMLLRESGKIEGHIEYIERRIAEREKRTHTSPPIPFERVEGLVAQVESLAHGAGSSDVRALERVVQEIVATLRAFLNDVTRESVHDAERVLDEESLNTNKKEKKSIEEKLVVCAEKETTLVASYEALRARIEAEVSESREAEREVFRIMSREQELRQTLNRFEREFDALERDRAEFKRELEEAVSLIGRAVTEYFSYIITDESGAEISREQIVSEDRALQMERRRTLEKMKIRLEELGAGGGDEVMKEYTEAKERDDFLAREIADLEQSIVSLESLIRELGHELNQKFIEGIQKIDTEFTKFFSLMFGGGGASLKRVKVKRSAQAVAEDGEGEGEDPLAEEGIEIDVSLPNKRVRGLEMLSGGERALTSIALIFAMSQVNPPPFVILDETDAALDEANSKRYGDMIESLSQKSQLILITHNRETMSRAGVLYGVTMGSDGVSKLLSIKLEDAVEVAK